MTLQSRTNQKLSKDTQPWKVEKKKAGLCWIGFNLHRVWPCVRVCVRRPGKRKHL